MKNEENILDRINKLLEETLNDDTVSFLHSIKNYWIARGYITPGQYHSLEKIESRFSPQEKDRFEKWKKDYLKYHVKEAKIVARYYVEAGYYVTSARKILSDESYIPTEKQYKRMVENKYAQKILTATNSIPKFSVDQVVQVRSKITPAWEFRKLRGYENRLAFVIANDLPIVNAVKGAKRYRILPMGSTELIEIDERFLMKPNKRGQNK
jgi:retron-type reverse transcriptase